MLDFAIIQKLYGKDFDKWNKIKKRLNANIDSSNPFPKERWVWLCVVGVNVGFEQDGRGYIVKCLTGFLDMLGYKHNHEKSIANIPGRGVKKAYVGSSKKN